MGAEGAIVDVLPLDRALRGAGSGSDRGDVDQELDLLSDEESAGSEVLLPRQAEVVAVDRPAHRDADRLDAPRIDGGALDGGVELDLPS